MYSVELKPPARDAIKGKKNAALKQVVDEQVKKILQDPYKAEAKWGDLKGVRVHDFSFSGAMFSIAFEIDEDRQVITLLHIGPHENFYKRLKRYLFG
jgi:mRNA-degrading endonuclease RelE of RelBE toxin-antitoxin system